ncbi:hypothetical protein G9C98_001574 [Cotesia typhae]|uniref:EGF-like domain-containing protein n=1 Tax=Cotesia typhae TaxID=2053667 RepID=A0A8J5R1S1_9HYME|nr:hypothetical protein G9C98_001574 [Cotesia typhae]
MSLERMKILVIALGLLLVASILEAKFYRDHGFPLAERVGDRCDRQRSCKNVRNSEYSRGKCKCLPNYRPSRPWGRSICKGAINAFCESDDDCLNSDEIFCIFNTCQNYTNFLDSDVEVTKLYRTTSYRSRCETDEHCSNMQKSVCIAGKCDCIDGYGSDPFGICVPLDKRYFKNNKSCWTNKVTCFEYYCMLPEEFFMEANVKNITTYTANSLGDACQVDFHCSKLDNARCQGGKCTCKDGYYDSMCICLYQRTFMIERDYEANVLAFECSLKNCSSDSKIAEASQTSTASKHYQCSHGTRCYLNTCRYFNEFFSSDDADKYTTAGMSGYRSVLTTMVLQGRDFRLGIRLRNFWADKCQEWPMRKCDDRPPCLIEYDEQCVLGVCKMKSELYLNPESIDLDLYVAKSHYEFCVIDHHCRDLNNTHCRNGACECLLGYEVVFDTCQKIIEKNFTRNIDCLLPGSYCFFDTCMMFQDFIALSSNKTSTYVAKYEGFCQTTHQCRDLEETICTKSVCTWAS